MKTVVRVKVRSVIGERAYQEDRYVKENNGNFGVYGVYDGHGGSGVSEYLEKNVHENLFNNIITENQIPVALKNVFLDIDKHLSETKEYMSCGSTATIVMIINSCAYFVNIGDSRGILIRNKKVVYSTKDHKPSDPSELIRIENAGGFVSQHLGGGPLRVNATLAVSRAIGDFDYKMDNVYMGENSIVSPVPDITKCSLEKGDVIVVASDGLWDVISNDEIAEINEITCDELVSEALDRGSMDNITVMTIKIR